MGNYHNYHNYRNMRAFGFYGGKTRLAREIADMLDYSVSTYLEPFGGGAAVLLNKSPHSTEVYAERSIALCCFWRCMSQQDTALELIDRLYDSDYDREAFERYCNTVNVVETGEQRLNDLQYISVIEVAAACFVVYSFGRDSAGLRFRDRQKKHTAYLKSVDRLIEVANRFRGVEVVHGDALELLSSNRFNNNDIMIYIDPVYLPEAGRKRSSNHTLYRYSFDRSEHIHMLERVREMESRILISGYDDDTNLYDRYLLGGENLCKSADGFQPWKRYEIEAVSSVARGDKRRVEVLWVNF